jgi:hypothetical protein
MVERDKLSELLNQHLSGYEPPLPENDWHNFRYKMKAKGNNWRLLYRLGIYPLIGLLIFLNLPFLKQVEEKIFVSKDEKKLITTARPSEKTVSINKGVTTTNTQQILKSRNEQTNSTIAKKSENTLKQGHNNPPVYNMQKTVQDKEENNSKVTHDEIKQSIQRNNDLETTRPIQNEIKTIPIQLNDNSKKEEEKSWQPNDLPSPLKQTPDITKNLTDSSMIEPMVKPLKQKKQGALYFRVVFSADYTSAKYEIPGSFTKKVHEDYSLLRKDAEKGGWGYSVGINLEYFIQPRLSLSSGIFFDENRITGKYNFYNNKIPVFDSLTGKIIGYVPDYDSIGIHTSFTNSIQYLEVPLIFNYNIWEKKNLVVGVKAGIDGFIFLNAKGTTIDKNDLSLVPINSNDYNSFAWGSIAGINIRYKINDRFILGIEPVWKKYWGSVYNEESMVVSKPSTLAINASFLIKIR